MSSIINKSLTAPPDSSLHYILKQTIDALVRREKEGQNQRVHELFLQFFQSDQAVIDCYKSNNNSLSEVLPQLKKLGVEKQKISRFCHQTLQMEKMQEAPAHCEMQEDTRPAIMECFVDFECPDRNGGQFMQLELALLNEACVITTRSILQQSNTVSNNHRPLKKELISKIKNGYRIFESGPYLVFIPKELAASSTSQLEMLDLNPEILAEIHFKKAFKRKDGPPPSIETFQTLFIKKPKHKKMVYLLGHGNLTSVASLTSKSYLQFLQWANKQLCSGLFVTSCKSGGKNTMLHLPKQGGVSFPVMTSSTGDFASFFQPRKMKQMQVALDKIWSSPGGKTLQKSRQVIHRFESEVMTKRLHDAFQIYFPPHTNNQNIAPYGFRVVGENAENFVLTLLSVRTAQIQNRSLTIQHNNIFISTPLIECPLLLQNQHSTLYSQVPGQAHHFFKSITLEMATVESFLEQNMCSSHKLTKVFFIETLSSAEKTCKKVFLDTASQLCGFEEDGQYYLHLSSLRAPCKVSAQQYQFQLISALKSSFPDEESVQVSTGGQQSARDVEQIVTSQWCRTIDTVPENLSERISYICHSLKSGKKEEACELFKKWKLDVNSKDELGIPIILHAAENDALHFMQFLLGQGANPNACDPQQTKTALSIALEQNNIDMVKLLLAQDTLSLTHMNKSYKPFCSTALINPQFREIVLKKLSREDLQKVCTHMSIEVSNLPNSDIEILLKQGVDATSLFPIAIFKNDREKIELLLKFGANPYSTVTDSNLLEKVFPITLAMRHSPLEILDMLLAIHKPAMNQSEEEALHKALFISAMQTADTERVARYLSVSSSRPLSLYLCDIPIILQTLFLFDAIDEKNLLQALCRHIAVNCVEGLEHILSPDFRVFIEKSIDPIGDMRGILTDLKKRRQKLSIQGLTDLFSFSPSQELIKFAIQNDLVDCQSVAQILLMRGDFETIQSALQHGLTYQHFNVGNFTRQECIEAFKRTVSSSHPNLNEKINDYSLFHHVIASGNFALYQFCLQHGAVVDPQDRTIIEEALKYAKTQNPPGSIEIREHI